MSTECSGRGSISGLLAPCASRGEDGEGENGQQGELGEPHEVPLSIGRRVTASLAFTLPLSSEEGDRVSRGPSRSRRAEVRAPPGGDVSEDVGDSRVRDPV